MLDLARCQILESLNYPVLSTVTSIEEGQLLQIVREAGKGVVNLSSGAANQIFGGVAVGKPMRPTTKKEVENFTVPGSVAYTVTLAHAPTSGAALGVQAADGSMLVAGTVDGATKYSISGQVVTVYSGLAGQALKVTYTRDLTAAEAAYLYGSDFAVLDFGAAPDIGQITGGVIYTTNYDPNVNWDSTAAITMGAGGTFTKGGSGPALDAVVISVPTADDVFLGIRIKP